MELFCSSTIAQVGVECASCYDSDKECRYSAADYQSPDTAHFRFRCYRGQVARAAIPYKYEKSSKKGSHRLIALDGGKRHEHFEARAAVFYLLCFPN